jgi:hypothetical protein
VCLEIDQVLVVAVQYELIKERLWPLGLFVVRLAHNVRLPEPRMAMYELGGGSSVYLSSPLQRRFRDAHVGTQHLMVAAPTWELAGRVLMGLPTDATLL